MKFWLYILVGFFTVCLILNAQTYSKGYSFLNNRGCITTMYYDQNGYIYRITQRPYKVNGCIYKVKKKGI